LIQLFIESALLRGDLMATKSLKKRVKKAAAKKKASPSRAKIKSAIKSATLTKDNVHVIFHAKGWAIKKEGSKKARKVYNTKLSAISGARKMAKNSKGILVVHGKDGKITQKQSYQKKTA
jgi:hypothetical protein